MGPCFVSTEGGDIGPDGVCSTTFNGGVLRQHGRQSCGITHFLPINNLQWGRASSARKADAATAYLKQHFEPSMGPCFVSTEGRGSPFARIRQETFNGAVLRQHGRQARQCIRNRGRKPSMGPCFVSTEGTWILTVTRSPHPFNGAVLRQHGRQNLNREHYRTVRLQWGRASSARKAS